MACPHCDRLNGMTSQIDIPPPADRHLILRHSCESACPSSARCFCFPRVTPTPLTTGVFSIKLFIVFIQTLWALDGGPHKSATILWDLLIS